VGIPFLSIQATKKVEDETMGARGPKSAASLAVIGSGGILTIRRPDPPRELTSEQTNVWREVLDDLPADWFRPSNLALLEAYCRHVVASRRVAQLIEAEEQSDGFTLERYDFLLRVQEREGRALSSLATRMRLTQQATFDEKKRKPQTLGKKPWEPDDEAS
jgi:hypothetical protein